MRWSYICCSFLILSVGAYLDNVRGPLIPLLTHRFGIPYGKTSWFLVLASVVGLATNLLLLPLLRYWGERKVILVMCLIGGLTTISGFWVTDFPSLLGMAGLIGCAVASMGTLSNVLAIQGSDEKSRSKLLCAVHMMYGFGSLLAPMTASFLLDRGFAWNSILVACAPLVLLIAFLVVRYLPSVKDVPAVEANPGKLSFVQKILMAVFGVYVVGECMTTMWMTTYLVEAEKFSVAQGARYVTGFFLMMGITRALCFLSLKPRHETFVVTGCLILSSAAFVAGRSGWLWAFPLAGILGPFFPLLLSRVSRNFPVQSRSMTVWILVSVQLGLALAYALMGRLTDMVGISVTYWVPFIFLVGTLGLLGWYFFYEFSAKPVQSVA